MTKTPEEMAEEYLRKMWGNDGDATQEMHCVSDFLAGYKAAQQWISVKDRLPEEDVAVLVYGQILNDPPDIIGIRRRLNGDQEWKYSWESEDGFIYRKDDVTHWQPLPEAPKEEK